MEECKIGYFSVLVIRALGLESFHRRRVPEHPQRSQVTSFMIIL